MVSGLERAAIDSFLPVTLCFGTASFYARGDLGITFNVADVAAWADQSGAGNDVAQATAAQQPLWVRELRNGKAGVRNTASSSDQLFRANSNLIGTGAYSWYWAGSCADSASVKGIVGCGSGSGGVNLRKDNSNNKGIVHPGVEFHSDAAMGTGFVYWVATRGAAAAPALWEDSVAISITTATSTVADAGGAAQLAIGNEGAAAFSSDSDHCEVLLALSALSTGARLRIQDHARARYAK